jgi:hypothetical protein
MKIMFWVLAAGLTIALLQYSIFKENGEPRHIPTLQQILR